MSHRIQVNYRQPGSVDTMSPQLHRLLNSADRAPVLRDRDEAAKRDEVFAQIIAEVQARGAELSPDEVDAYRVLWQGAWAWGHMYGTLAARRAAEAECVALERCVAFSEGGA